MPTRTERYRFLPFTIEDVNAIPQPLPGGYADVTRGGGMTFERVVFLGPDGTSRAELHLKKGHSFDHVLIGGSTREAMRDCSSFFTIWKYCPPSN
jgi:hypothetical protein